MAIKSYALLIFVFVAGCMSIQASKTLDTFGLATNIADDFESSTLDTSTWNVKPDDLPAEAVLVKRGNPQPMSGKQFVSFSLRPGWDFQEGIASTPATERAEIQEGKRVRAPIKTELWYSFYMYVPSAFESTGSRLVIGQWKQEFLDDNISYSPSIAQRFIDGKFFVTRDGEDTFVNHNDGNEGGTHQQISRPLHLARDRWIRMIYNVRFSASDDGFIKAWMDGEQIVDYAGHGTFGRTAYKAQSSGVYFKFGLYRDVDPACTVNPNARGCTMTIYFDHYCRGASRADVEADCSDDVT